MNGKITIQNVIFKRRFIQKDAQEMKNTREKIHLRTKLLGKPICNKSTKAYFSMTFSVLNSDAAMFLK